MLGILNLKFDTILTNNHNEIDFRDRGSILYSCWVHFALSFVRFVSLHHKLSTAVTDGFSLDAWCRYHLHKDAALLEPFFWPNSWILQHSLAGANAESSSRLDALEGESWESRPGGCWQSKHHCEICESCPFFSRRLKWKNCRSLRLLDPACCHRLWKTGGKPVVRVCQREILFPRISESPDVQREKLHSTVGTCYI